MSLGSTVWDSSSSTFVDSAEAGSHDEDDPLGDAAGRRPGDSAMHAPVEQLRSTPRIRDVPEV